MWIFQFVISNVYRRVCPAQKKNISSCFYHRNVGLSNAQERHGIHSAPLHRCGDRSQKISIDDLKCRVCSIYGMYIWLHVYTYMYIYIYIYIQHIYSYIYIYIWNMVDSVMYPYANHGAGIKKHLHHNGWFWAFRQWGMGFLFQHYGLHMGHGLHSTLNSG